MLANPRKSHLFSVKMMRIDTVAGLLTTALSRTYPPLIPPHIQEMFQNPNGRFFFELLGMLPELNRYLFVEILDLCCALVDQQAFNQISHSKLAVFPGSCCFGLNEFKPNWDTRHLMGADLRRFSSAFYHAIYAYREERDLTEEQLQEKLDTRARVLEQERIAALEREHGYKGAQAILRMEARIAQGLPAESPNTMKEIDLYADRKEKVVADDAISILDIKLGEDDDEDGSKVPGLAHIREEDEEPEVENVQAVIRDLRRSVSVASLGKSTYENQPRLPISPPPALSLAVSTSGRKGYMSPVSPISPTTPMSPKSIFSGTGFLSRSNTLARSVSLKLHPVSPGDIFGISQRAVEKRELEGFLAVARTVTVKRRRTAFNKRALQQRQAHKMRILAAAAPTSNQIRPLLVATISTKSIRTLRRHHRSHNTTTVTPLSGTSMQGCPPVPTAAALRRERAKKFRKEIEAYKAKGLSLDEAIQARDADIKQARRRERRAKRAAQAKAEAEREAAAAAAVAGAIAQHGGLIIGEGIELTSEEAEILEAFDYLSDEEFQEFKELAGLTDENIKAIQAKAAALSLSKVTQEIKTAPIPVISESVQMKRNSFIPAQTTVVDTLSEQTPVEESETTSPHTTDDVDAQGSSNNRPFNIRHMTSMDMMFKHASVVGDANLRLYPTRPSSPTISDYESDSMHGGLLSRAASVMRSRMYNDDSEEVEDDNNTGDDEDSNSDCASPSASTLLQPATLAPPAIPYTTRPNATLKDDAQEVQEEIDSHQHHLVQQQQSNSSFVFEVEETVESEEEAELRELLESMSPEERTEFLRLSNQEAMGMSMASSVLVHP
ncbi:hypothetical protein BCR41DRAFT_240513 [Lobosporangium transversale]|uniref:Uncharacterized protein n=1 Tax=Lobosporangium transversale TaxID=64571 RepID=A0A1Y2G5J4_9FUNG|nr:hypothetical protein BCR41DRAFT_240513 [Lobosporangium transversale]ORY95174.1 hypothetical protein BCR41DRAFT_240513 [Lobosporangium transversale]|eukprot:XP_021875378.1 hypothetical protein BCR41DRAFT_240513 [Lobosporangium transversale]